MEVSVGDRNEDNKGDNNEKKEAECLVYTFPEMMEEDVTQEKFSPKNNKRRNISKRYNITNQRKILLPTAHQKR